MRKQKEYLDKKLIDPMEFYSFFKTAYHYFQGKEFDEISNDGEARKFARTLIFYFLSRKKFLDSPLLNFKSQPNLNKGLLVIGNYGTGKSSIFRTFHQLFFESNSGKIFMRFKNNYLLSDFQFGFVYQTVNQIVKDFEGCSSPEERKFFWEKITKGTRYFDDLTTEKEASNFGKTNLFEDILEMRYEQKTITLASMNYAGNSVEDTLDFLAKKYGERVYDRLFEMFNIIELKGKSFRK